MASPQGDTGLISSSICLVSQNIILSTPFFVVEFYRKLKYLNLILIPSVTQMTSERPEFNLKQDVGGAQVLFDSGVSLVMIPCKGVTSHLTSTVPEIEKYVEPHGEIGKFLSLRFIPKQFDQLIPVVFVLSKH